MQTIGLFCTHICRINHFLTKYPNYYIFNQKHALFTFLRFFRLFLVLCNHNEICIPRFPEAVQHPIGILISLKNRQKSKS